MTVFELKTWPEFFNAIMDERKKFEIRLADRPFEVGDGLLLKEYEMGQQRYTGREILVRVTYIMHMQGKPLGFNAERGEYAVMSFDIVEIRG